MQAHKLQVKVFAAPATKIAPEAFIPVFHRWIKNRVLPELMIDVASYAHVPRGPGIALIGHSSDYFIDEAAGRLGLLFSHKRVAPSPAERLEDAFRRALHAALLLEREPDLAGKLTFSGRELLFRINDRLLAPHTDATFEELRPELQAFGDQLFGGPCDLVRVGGPRDLFAVRLVSSGETTLDALLGRLAARIPLSQT